jgi:4-amino-4-deoxy-L-arabinose transferase-like glycosyltransferase
MIESRAFTKTDLLLLGVLLALVLPLRCWLLYNTEVTARDSIGYIRYALQFERLPWHEVLEKNHQHPGYPVCVHLMSHAVLGEEAPTPDNMRLCAQLVSFLASLVLAVLMYVLGRQFFDATISFGASLLYQYLPISAHHLSDGVSEPVYLVLLVSGLLFMVIALRERAVLPCVLCGVFAGLAYLTRPEGLFIVPAFGLTLMLTQTRAEWRSSWPRFFACGTTMLLAAMLVGAIYVGATGRITNKLSAIETLRNLWQWIQYRAPAAQGDCGGLQLFAATFTRVDSRHINFWNSVRALFMELLQGLHYAGIVPALFGFYFAFKDLRRESGFWALLIFAGLHAFILVALGMSVGYVSDRHIMILVIGASYFVVLGLRELPTRIFSAEPTAWYRSAIVWSVVCFALLFLACLPKTMQRLHGNRIANHQAGLWLGEHRQVGDHIEDDHSWSAYWSGYTLREGDVPVLAQSDVPTTYVVLTRSRDPEIGLKRNSEILSKNARVVFQWPERESIEKARVVVYAQPRDFGRNPWTKAP